MKHDRGFRIPEPNDKAIRWPSRKGAWQIMAFYQPQAQAWLVPGIERAFGDPLKLVQEFGNDWHVLYVEQATEAAS